MRLAPQTHTGEFLPLRVRSIAVLTVMSDGEYTSGMRRRQAALHTPSRLRGVDDEAHALTTTAQAHLLGVSLSAIATHFCHHSVG